MGRRIKFRGKRLDNGEWVYGYLINSSKMRIAWISSHNEDGDLTHVEVIPSTIGQMIDRFDLSNNDAYEGDIFKDQNNVEWVISWSPVNAGFYAGLNGAEYQKSKPLGSIEIAHIIGNIHEKSK